MPDPSAGTAAAGGNQGIMKTFRSVFEENYLPYEEPCDNRQGFRVRYQYVGPWYVPSTPRGRGKTYGRLCVWLCLLCTAAALGTAFVDHPLNYQTPLSFFGTLALAPLLFVWYGAIRLSLEKERVTQESYHEISMIMHAAPLIAAGLFFCASCAGLYMILSGKTEDLTAAAAGLPVLHLACAVICIGIRRIYGSVRWAMEKNDALEDPAKKYIRKNT